jgi:multidrug resistance efflux pump
MYKKELQEIQDELEHHRRIVKYAMEEEAQKTNIAQQRQDLKALEEAANRRQQMKQAEKDRAEAAKKAEKKVPRQNTDEMQGIPSTAQEDWNYSKEFEGARSKPLDELMDMIGLEDVKLQFLDIKATVDTKVGKMQYLMLG